jgi:methyl-accepting chemotaxis protein
MKIRGKINLIVGIMSLLAIAITGMSLLIVSEYNGKLRQFQNASERAFKGERLNRLVTAVVMESRGIYAAPTIEKAAPFAEGLIKNLDKIDALLTDWRPLVPADKLRAFDAVAKRAEEFKTFRTETARLGREVAPQAANEQGNNEANRANRKAFQAEIDVVVDADRESLQAITADLDAFERWIVLAVLGIAGLGMAAGIGAAYYIGTNQLSRPIVDLTGRMKLLAGGDLSVDVPFAGRKDEIGDMAAAVEVFKQNGLAVRELNAQEAALREKSADLQSSIGVVVAAAAAGDFSKRIGKDYDNDDLNRFAASVNSGIAETRRVIASLAAGDLTLSMNGQFHGAFAELQKNVNDTLSTLQKTLREVRTATDSINGNASELRSASDDLSKRTEQQAASLEETSAALDEITAAVKSSTERAQEATMMVTEAKENAAESASVVRSAIEAMGRIEQASSEIGQITNVIDEIAFQTNLLALNAGVEAARAGDAGKGFAVVAQEVRELAQRAASAAKDIKALISKSGGEVATGVKLVQATGAALDEIETRVLKINDHIHSIATAAREQSTGLSEVSSAVNQMDQVTQQNAAMVEEATAATHKLSAEADNLAGLIAYFKVERDQTRAVAPAGEASRPVASPARRMIGTVTRAFGGSSTAAARDDWQEF